MEFDIETTRQMVFTGMQRRKTYPLDGVDLQLRPLSYVEKSLLQSQALAGMNIDIDITKLDVDADMQKQFMKGFGSKMSGEKIGAMTLNSAKANAQICAWCIVAPGPEGKPLFTLEEINTQFPGEHIPLIADAARELSGMQQEDQQKLDRFRQKSGGN